MKPWYSVAAALYPATRQTKKTLTRLFPPRSKCTPYSLPPPFQIALVRFSLVVLLGGPLLLALDVEVVAGVGSGHVEAVPASSWSVPSVSIVLSFVASLPEEVGHDEASACDDACQPSCSPPTTSRELSAPSDCSSKNNSQLIQFDRGAGVIRRTEGDAEVQDEVSSEHL